MPTILVTCFEPFDGASSNPSQEVAEQVARLVDGVRTLTLPVSFVRSRSELRTALTRHAPDIAIGLGLAVNRSVVSFERLAVNLADARIADNDGEQPGGVELTPGAEAAMWTNLPVKAAVRELAGHGVELSMSAGTYVCNAVFYELMCWAARAGSRAGFVHVPPVHSEAELEHAANAVATLARLTQAGTVELAVPLGDIS